VTSLLGVATQLIQRDYHGLFRVHLETDASVAVPALERHHDNQRPVGVLRPVAQVARGAVTAARARARLAQRATSCSLLTPCSPS
jgi:hypothetical protein